MDKDKAQEQVHRADIGDEIEKHSIDEKKTYKLKNRTRNCIIICA